MPLLVKIVTCGVLAGVWLAAAGAAGSPKLAATVKTLSSTSRLVHIVNRDTVTYDSFVVQSVRSPRITGATKPCRVERDLNYNGTTSTWRYKARCRKALAPRHALDIRLTTVGGGRLAVYVVLKGALVEIDT
jgi:hypothetical protein